MNIAGGKCCPLCSHELMVGATIWNPDLRILLTPTKMVTFHERQAALFNALWHRQPEFATWEILAREVWGYGFIERGLDAQRKRDTNRSPNAFHMAMSRIRDKLRGTGFRIQSNRKRELGWRIVRDSIVDVSRGS